LATSPIHLSKALGVRTSIKFLDATILANNPSSNLPAFNFSMSKNTENPLSCKNTFNRLKNREK
jgi:hypothetical protein